MLLNIIWALLPFPMAWSGRMNGGAPPKLPWGLDAWIISAPFALLAWEVCNMYMLSYWWMVLPFATSYLGQRLGHGQYFDLAEYRGKQTGAEKIDFIVKAIFGPDPQLVPGAALTTPGNFWRDLFGLSLTGLVTGIGMSILLGVAGLWLLMPLPLIFGALKGPLYVVGDVIEEKTDFTLPHLTSHTEWGELFTGFVRILGCSVIHFML